MCCHGDKYTKPVQIFSLWFYWENPWRRKRNTCLNFSAPLTISKQEEINLNLKHPVILVVKYNKEENHAKFRDYSHITG